MQDHAVKEEVLSAAIQLHTAIQDQEWETEDATRMFANAVNKITGRRKARWCSMVRTLDFPKADWTLFYVEVFEDRAFFNDWWLRAFFAHAKSLAISSHLLGDEPFVKEELKEVHADDLLVSPAPSTFSRERHSMWKGGGH